jgi:DNA-binding NarL/FixJ family response regulator
VPPDQLEPGATSAPKRLAPLSPRSLLVLQLLARGYSREQVARLLAVPAAAIEETEWSVSALLGASTVDEAIRRARRRRLIL